MKKYIVTMKEVHSQEIIVELPPLNTRVQGEGR